MEGELDTALMTRYFVLTCVIDPEHALPLVLANRNIHLDQAIQVTNNVMLDTIYIKACFS